MKTLNNYMEAIFKIHRPKFKRIVGDSLPYGIKFNIFFVKRDITASNQYISIYINDGEHKVYQELEVSRSDMGDVLKVREKINSCFEQLLINLEAKMKPNRSFKETRNIKKAQRLFNACLCNMKQEPLQLHFPDKDIRLYGSNIHIDPEQPNTLCIDNERIVVDYDIGYRVVGNYCRVFSEPFGLWMQTTQAWVKKTTTI